MFVVGVTGGIGSGKTAATDHFQTLGITVVDADLASRAVVEPGRPALAKIKAHFGPDVIDTDGTLNRRTLRTIVFSHPEERHWLEALTHPLIAQEIKDQISASHSPYTILVSPLLLEGNQRTLVDRVLVIDAPESDQITRTIARDQTNKAGVEAIMTAQLPRSERLACADDIIVNDKSLADLQQTIEQIHHTYLQLAQDKSNES